MGGRLLRGQSDREEGLEVNRLGGRFQLKISMTLWDSVLIGLDHMCHFGGL